jgi:hypothetical protein
MKLALDNLEKENPKVFQSYQNLESEMCKKFGDTGVVRQLELDRVISHIQAEISQKDTEDQELLSMQIKKKLLPALGYAKPLVTAITHLDPYKIAPWVVAGVFFTLEVPQPLSFPVLL